MSKKIVFLKVVPSFLILFTLTGCYSPEPIRIQSAKQWEPLSSVQCSRNIVVAPVVLTYQAGRKPDNPLPLGREIKLDQEIPTQQEQDEIRNHIYVSLRHLLEQEGFRLQDVNQETETLLAEISKSHASLISQYRPKDLFHGLLESVHTLSNADGVILVDVLVKQGLPGHYDPIFSGSASESTSYTTFKIAYISTEDAKHKWYSESYSRKFLKETDIESVLKMLIVKDR